MPVVGSSINMILGFPIVLIASDILRFMPPLNVEITEFLYSSKLTDFNVESISFCIKFS